MGRKWIFFCWIALFAFIAEAKAHETLHKPLCEGFLPKNDMQIPDSGKRFGGVTKAQFDQVLDRIAGLYTAEIKRRGGRLRVIRDWKNKEVNAFADQTNGVWTIHMFGGLARHRTITADGFAVVACHEIGHHLGGAPKYDEQEWATNEGEADYYSTLKCLRRYFDEDDNEKILSEMTLDPVAVSTCEVEHRNRPDQLICIRTAMAGLSLAGLFQDLSGDKRVKLETPDTRKVKKMYHQHPASQCRLDTYFQGGLCTVPVREGRSDTDYRPGSCYSSKVHARGLRPRCWFKP